MISKLSELMAKFEACSPRQE